MFHKYVNLGERVLLISSSAKWLKYTHIVNLCKLIIYQCEFLSNHHPTNTFTHVKHNSGLRITTVLSGCLINTFLPTEACIPVTDIHQSLLDNWMLTCLINWRCNRKYSENIQLWAPFMPITGDINHLVKGKPVKMFVDLH